jgi:hypothetical protein
MIYDVGLAGFTAEFDQETEGFFIGKSNLLVLLEAATRLIQFDEGWYLSQYPDVVDAIAQGIYQTPYQHYVQHGFMECRLPHRIEVDEEFYLSEYSDVRDSLANKKIPSAQWHFENHGRSEGRIPCEGFSILNTKLDPGVLSST